GLPAKPRPDVALEPFIEHMVQVDVSKQRRQDRALRRPLLRLAVLLPVENSHVQALSDQSQERRVAHPLPKHLQEHLADDAVEVALDVSLQNPAHARRPPVEGTEGLVCAASRPEAVRVGRENRLVDRFQQLAERPLYHLVLGRRDADRSRLARRLRDVDATQRLGPVSAGPPPPPPPPPLPAP